MPKVSIGLPVYNGEDFLPVAIESVLSQDFTDFELVISDNASQDRTAEICQGYASRDPRIRYFRGENNRGGAWNYNRVFELSRGEYFKWQAHDDICLPGFLSRCVAVLDAAPASVVLAFPRTGIVDGEGNPVEMVSECLEARQARPHQRLGLVLQRLNMACAQFGVMRSSALRQTRLFDRMIAADYVLMAELAMLGEFWEVPEVLFQRRIHERISTRANRGASALLRWWDPSASGYRGWVSPMMRLGWEYVRSIRRMPLSPGERARCYLTAVSVWYPREFRNLGGRWKARLRQSVWAAGARRVTA